MLGYEDYQIDIFRFVELIPLVFLLYVFAEIVISSIQQRLILFGLLIGLLFYSGIGTLYIETPHYLLYSYFLLSLSVILGFLIGKKLFLKIGRIIGVRSDMFFSNIDTYYLSKQIVFIYMCVNLSVLIYPEFKLHLLIDPPSPNISVWFDRRFFSNDNVYIKIISYVEYTLYPFVYIALYYLRKKTWLVVLFVVIIRYIEYVESAYISRGALLIDILFVVYLLSISRPYKRKLLIASFLMSIPFISWFANYYGQIRQGYIYRPVGLFDSMKQLFLGESAWVPRFATFVIDSGKQVDISSYFTWIITLPIPGFFKDGFHVALINYEIAELITGKHPGDANFSVTLAGLLVESYYLYGSLLFWLHGIFLGFIASVIARIVEGTKAYSFIGFMYATLFFYILNRAGVGASLPIIINTYLFFYVFLFVIVVRAPFKKDVVNKSYIAD